MQHPLTVGVTIKIFKIVFFLFSLLLCNGFSKSNLQFDVRISFFFLNTFLTGVTEIDF